MSKDRASTAASALPLIAFFIVGHAVLAWFVGRFQEKNGESYRPVRAKTEWLWALVPVLVMAVVIRVQLGWPEA